MPSSRGDPLGDRPGRDPARLGVADDPVSTALAAAELEADLRQLRGLAGPRLARDHDDLVVADGGGDVVTALRDRQLRRKGDVHGGDHACQAAPTRPSEYQPRSQPRRTSAVHTSLPRRPNARSSPGPPVSTSSRELPRRTSSPEPPDASRNTSCSGRPTTTPRRRSSSPPLPVTRARRDGAGDEQVVGVRAGQHRPTAVDDGVLEPSDGELHARGAGAVDGQSAQRHLDTAVDVQLDPVMSRTAPDRAGRQGAVSLAQDVVAAAEPDVLHAPADRDPLRGGSAEEGHAVARSDLEEGVLLDPGPRQVRRSRQRREAGARVEDEVAGRQRVVRRVDRVDGRRRQRVVAGTAVDPAAVHGARAGVPEDVVARSEVDDVGVGRPEAPGVHHVVPVAGEEDVRVVVDLRRAAVVREAEGELSGGSAVERVGPWVGRDEERTRVRQEAGAVDDVVPVAARAPCTSVRPGSSGTGTPGTTQTMSWPAPASTEP